MGALDWTMTEADAGASFVLLKPGNYPFTVKMLERGRHDGSAKIGACPKATITIGIDGGAQGSTDSKVTLILDSTLEWKIGAFFKAIGAPENPSTGKVVVNWNDIIGKQGWCRVETRTYTGNDGKQHETNDVKYFIDPTATVNAGPDPEEQAPAPLPQTPQYPAATYPQPQTYPAMGSRF